MKKFLFVLIGVLISFNGMAQKFEKYTEDEILSRFEEMKKNFTDNNGEWTFERIIEIKGSKDDIYKAATQSLSEIYIDSKEVIESSDKEIGMIIAKGRIASEFRPFNAAWNVRTIVDQNVKIDIKDNRYRITLKFDRLSYQTADINEGQLVNFFPYAQSIKPKYRSRSFEHLETAYDLALSMIDLFEAKIKEALKDSEW